MFLQLESPSGFTLWLPNQSIISWAAMGNFTSTNNDTNISQTQIQTQNQKCTQNATAEIQGVTITAIGSHLGDIDLSSTVSVGDMSCVLSAFTQATATISLSDVTKNDISSLPFQQTINNSFVNNSADIQSYQQSLIDQTCVESASSSTNNIVMTFIDSSTGNIKVASKTAVQSFSCNLQACSYQTLAVQVANDTSNKISSGCCSFDLGMLIPVVLGLVGLVVVSKLAKGKGDGGEGGGGLSENSITELATTALARQNQSDSTPTLPPRRSSAAVVAA